MKLPKISPFYGKHQRQTAAEINPILYKSLREIEKVALNENIKKEYNKIPKTVNLVENLSLSITFWNDWVDEALEPNSLLFPKS